MKIHGKIEHVVTVASTVFLIAAGFVVLAYAVRIFICDQYPVNTRSMTPTIQPGDHILVNKLLFGARIYKNLRFLNHPDAPMESWRVAGLREIEHNDIVVFNFPFGNAGGDGIGFDINKVYAKRCLALPGDSISIIDGVYVNRSSDLVPGHIGNQLEFAATPDSLIDPVIQNTFPGDPEHYSWNAKNFGPLFVPRQGAEVALDTVNYKLYRALIEYETGQKLRVFDGRICLGDVFIYRYVFKGNYYFMGGDNVADSQDSRYFGLIPEDYIIGIVTRVLYSRDRFTGKLNGKRTLRTLY